MQTIKASFEIVTPMFIGGGDNDVELRPPSIKGALRFWWRALYWGQCLQDADAKLKLQGHQSTPEKLKIDALKLLHEREALLFGAAAKEGTKRGQGEFLLRVKHENLYSSNKNVVHRYFKPSKEITVNREKKVDPNHLAGARYLGYGLMVAFNSTNRDTRVTKHSGQLERSCLNEKQKFTVELSFRRTIDPSVQQALIALGLLGGLGSRSRHGMGSIALKSLRNGDKELWSEPKSKEDYYEKIQNLFPEIVPPTTTRPLSTSEPPFSAFWQDSRIDHLLSSNSCYDALDFFGKAMLMYRSWGRGGFVLGQASEKRFEDDHDWYRDPSFARKNTKFHPERVMFGLPHNYHQHHHHVTAENHERRSSPLLFHVHHVGNEFFGISIYLPAKFLPDGEQINANNKLVPAKVNCWSIITNFLDGKVGNPPAALANARFPSKQAILP